MGSPSDPIIDEARYLFQGGAPIIQAMAMELAGIHILPDRWAGGTSIAERLTSTGVKILPAVVANKQASMIGSAVGSIAGPVLRFRRSFG